MEQVFIKKLIKPGHSGLYIVEKISLQRANFDIVYDDSAHENMKNNYRKTTFFPQSSENKYH